jgi:hypothetical protein
VVGRGEPGGHALIERYRGGRWRVVDPGQVGSDFTNLWGVAVSGDKIWGVGTYKDGGPRNTLIMRHSES